MSTANSDKTKKIAIIFGSPNNQGNTAKLLDLFLSFCPNDTQAKLLCAYDLTINPCFGCDYCKTNGVCCQKKDSFAEIEQAIRESDIFIIATPIYFLGFPAPLKQVFDRFQAYFYHPPFNEKKRRKAVLLTTSGSNDELGPKQMENSLRYLLDTINASLVDVVSVKNTDHSFMGNPAVCQKAANKLFSDE